MLYELLEAADLNDAETDVVVEVLLPRLWERSGLDVLSFRAAVAAAMLSIPRSYANAIRGAVSPQRY